MEPIDELLQKYLAGHADAVQKQKVDNWIESHPKEFKHLKTLWQVSGAPSFHEVDSTAAMQVIDERIRISSQKSSRMVQMPIRRYVAAAAIILILIGSFILIQSQILGRQLTQSNTEFAQDLELSDGSQVAVNKGSILVYPKSFSRRHRNVELQSGNAFFDVSKDPSSPFIIQTPQGQIEVLGTSFNVFVGEDKTEVYVKTGRVMLSNQKTNETIQLSPEKAGVILPNELVNCTAISTNYLSWKTDRLEFIDADLNEVVESLERHFQIPVKQAIGSYSSIRFNGVFESHSLSEILEVVALTCRIEFQIKDDEIVLSPSK